eukprot:IDg17148t1
MSLNAFVATGPAVLGGSSFTAPAICNARPAATTPKHAPAQWTMGKNAKFGPFTPAILAGKLVLGDKQLNKLRGKGIKLHAQTIANFCNLTGTDAKTRMSLIQTAKRNGNTLGFL